MLLTQKRNTGSRNPLPNSAKAGPPLLLRKSPVPVQSWVAHADLIPRHRLSTIMNADRIIVVGDGTILESGDHETLIRSRGKYADLWSKQVFLKPKKSGKGASESTTPSTLINDLEPEAAETELFKAQAATDTGKRREGPKSEQTSESKRTSEGRGSEVDS